eukprot:6184455-Pleurochrysis_carterae.AAC.1
MHRFPLFHCTENGCVCSHCSQQNSPASVGAGMSHMMILSGRRCSQVTELPAMPAEAGIVSGATGTCATARSATLLSG